MKLCLRCNQYFEDSIELCPMDTSILEAVGEHPLIGALINDRYVVDSVIGKGSSGIVYKATRLLMGREVAVKVLHSYLGAEVGALDRFLREARAASRLRHPHIINIWESGVTDDAQPYFVMDYLEGLTLADLVRQKGYIHAGRAMPIITQICEALSEAHRQNIIHRDIKPENIVLETNEGDNNFDDYVKVLDFGIADAPAGTPGAPKQKTAAGSPAYMSPEQCQGFELDQRSDIYSLAIVIFEMLTGLRPFAADDVMKLFHMHVSQPPPTMSSMRADLRFPMQVELAVAKALAKNPDNRQQTIKEFHKELEDAFASSDMNAGGKRESVQVDLFSVPVVERLTDGSGHTSTGSHNFLPGPEDWEEPQPVEEPTPAPAPAPVAKAAETPDVSAAVNRLLKSAKRASEAVKQEDVGSWARDVLTRNESAPEPAEAKTEAPKPLKATGGQSPPEDSGPEISNWAHKVLSRATGEHATHGNNSQTGAGSTPPQSNAPSPAAKLPQPGNSSAPAQSLPGQAKAPGSVPVKPASPVPQQPGIAARTTSGGSGEQSGLKQSGKLAKPIELLKAKSAIDAARRNSGEIAAQSEEVIPGPNMSSFEKAQPNYANSNPASKTLSLKSAEPPSKSESLQPASAAQQQAQLGSGAASKNASPLSAPTHDPSNFDLSSEIDDLLDDVLPEPRQALPSKPEPMPAPEPLAQPKPAAMKPAEPATKSDTVNKPGIVNRPTEARPDSALKAGLPPKTEIPNKPLSNSQPPAAAAQGLGKSLGGSESKPAVKSPSTADQIAAARAQALANQAASAKPPLGSQTPAPRAPQTPLPSTPQTSQSDIPISKPETPISKPAASSPAPTTASGESPPFATTSSERQPFDLSRFEQPVNKQTESLNPFAQAIDGLLDAAIMPKTTEDVRRSANKLKKMEMPGEGATDSQIDLDRFEQPINSRSSFDPARFENPINKSSLADNVSQNNDRYEQPVNKGFISGSSTAGSKMLGASDAGKRAADVSQQSAALDVNRFERPIHEQQEELNPFAQAVDGLLDSARIKPAEPRVMATSSELGQTAAAVGKPPDAAAIEALDTTAEEDRVHDAVSRLIEAAKRTPEPTAKPEVLNKKIEAVKKKIEALKAADVAKPLSPGVPPSEIPPPPVMAPGPAPAAAAPAPFVPGPGDSNSLSDAVNRLLEAAQRQETSTTNPTVPPQMVNPFADAYSSPAPPPSVPATTSANNAPPVSNPFDAAASTSMVNPFAAAQAPPDPTTTSGTFRTSSAHLPVGPAPADPSKKPVEGSAFQNYVSAPTDRMTRAAELINNAIKSSKTPEVAQDYYSGFKNDPKQIQAERAEHLKKSRQRVRKNFQGPPKPPLWLASIAALLIGGGAAWYLGFLPFIPIAPPKATAPVSVDSAIKQGKFEKARELLEAKKKSGLLTASETDKLNNVYYQLGLKEGKDENYQDAVKDLKLIPRKSDLYPSAAAKIREYKKKMSDL